MKSSLFVLLILSLLAGIILSVLSIASSKVADRKNGFDRKIENSILREMGQLNLPSGVTKIANIQGDTVYLQTDDPELIYYTDDFQTLKKIEFKFGKTHKFNSLFTSYVKYPLIYIMGGNSRQFFKIDLISRKVDSTKLLVPGAFGNANYIDNNLWIVRYIDSSSYNSMFTKINTEDGSFITEDSISPKLNDAGFTNDGILIHQENSAYLSFIQFYNNKVTLFDTAFNIKGVFNTIDTCLFPGIQLRKDSNGVTNSAPPRMVNGPSAVSNGMVYIHSYLRADNERQNRGLIVIDRYELITGRYINSFYLPPTPGKNLIGLFISNDMLYALYNHMVTKARILN